MRAILNGQTEIVKILLDNGTGVTLAEKDNNGWTELMKASLNGQTEIVKILLDSGADATLAEKSKKGKTALMIASEMGHTEIVKILINNGAGETVGEKSNKGNTAFMIANQKGHTEIVNFLARYNFMGSNQEGYGPELWAMTLEQIENILNDPNVNRIQTMREVVKNFIKPKTEGKGVGYALHLNREKPLLAKTMVSVSMILFIYD